MSVNNKRASHLTSDTTNAKPVSTKQDEQESDDEEILPSITTTEGLALRLLNPKVHNAEAEEYASYVDQYRNLNLSNELQYEQSAADMELYEQAVRITKGNATLSNLLHVDASDASIYEKHVGSLRSQELGLRITDS
jgi:hypothetical protein